MARLSLVAAAAAVLLLAAPASAQRAPDPIKWRKLDAENTLVITSTQGPIVVEMFPEVAPAHVGRIKELTRERFYDNLTFHRVIDNFMAQTGDPTGDSTGASTKPDLNQEFQFKRGGDMPFVAASQQGGAWQGFYKTLAIETYPDAQMALTADGKVRAWALHCPGIASMARSGIVNGVDQVNSANSQFFLMRATYPSLDKSYTIWGRAVWGLDAILKLAVNNPASPVPNPDRMLSVRIMADLPETERVPLYVMRTDSADFRKLLDDTRRERGADFSICDVQIPARITGVGSINERDRPWWRNIPLIP
ncbi:MAG: peptidylprolyl isomerase [Hyphomonadaceae bacterium]|nr:peptidylprolyl isomerase [Hyphomonadaceae bacterium]